MRESSPMPAITSGASAPTRSQILAISLAKPIFIARNALAAYLIISALVSDVVNSGTDISARRPRHAGRRREDLRHQRLVEFAHHRQRGGIAAHHDAVGVERIAHRAAFAQEFRVAGHAETDLAGLRRASPMPSRTSASTRLPEPTGTVDLLTTTRNRLSSMAAPILRAAASR